MGKNVALLMTQYEKYGTVGRDEYIQYYIEEYEVVKKIEEDRDFLTWYVENNIDLNEEEIDQAIEGANKLIEEGY